MATARTVTVSHLGGIDVGYCMPAYDPAKPTLLMINSFATDVRLFNDLFASAAAAAQVNLLAIEPLGCGRTRPKTCAYWSHWDSAYMALQVLDALKVDKVFILGVRGLIPVSISFDCESARARELGCWDSAAVIRKYLPEWDKPGPTPDYVPTDNFSEYYADVNFGPDCPAEVRDFWVQNLKARYRGNAGRRELMVMSFAYLERGSMYCKLRDIRCPLLLIMASHDPVFSVENAKDEIQWAANSPEAKLVVVDGQDHSLVYLHSKKVEQYVLDFVKMYG
ncbi:hypothetical protein LOZ53_006474 [Ophidiomyces ophidiicola]|nr:hypothetical protein LOZ55_000737 [Ophidiomyces ophidiicola]KAI1981439.1 hypothetical protein LOZ53_006474 [Ophidiomyces ophidiicola]KAI1998098.1 hypothetical protein LOZ51_002775 [Ophidiomyces ophidiicola]KAI2002587.1 hypothetical protein LOZ49_006270 [Ophidiomyces ophidiicola]KAI2012565.1 hypothetical protein LOZ50_000021 [Ophidiomyces ophidiicola]